MIKIIAVGNIKESFFKEAILEYQKRISKYTKLEIIEVKDYDLDSPNLNMEKEKEAILKYITPKDFIVTLVIEGKEMTSPSFAEALDKWFMQKGNITFIIGGSNGLSKELKDMSNFQLSFSPMTFPHQLFRIILLEQIYRAYKIKNNESYHK